MSNQQSNYKVRPRNSTRALRSNAKVPPGLPGTFYSWIKSSTCISNLFQSSPKTASVTYSGAGTARLSSPPSSIGSLLTPALLTFPRTCRKQKADSRTDGAHWNETLSRGQTACRESRGGICETQKRMSVVVVRAWFGFLRLLESLGTDFINWDTFWSCGACGLRCEDSWIRWAAFESLSPGCCSIKNQSKGGTMQGSMYAEVCGLRTEPTASEEISHSRTYSLLVSRPVSSAATLISPEKSPSYLLQSCQSWFRGWKYLKRDVSQQREFKWYPVLQNAATRRISAFMSSKTRKIACLTWGQTRRASSFTPPLDSDAAFRNKRCSCAALEERLRATSTRAVWFGGIGEQQAGGGFRRSAESVQQMSFQFSAISNCLDELSGGWGRTCAPARVPASHPVTTHKTAVFVSFDTVWFGLRSALKQGETVSTQVAELSSQGVFFFLDWRKFNS